MNLKKNLTTLVGVAALTTAFSAQAVVQGVNANVTRILTDSVNFGGCMALLSVNPATVGLKPACNNWVSFSCTGTYAPKELAFQMFDNAQMALAMNKSVYVEVDDSKKFNSSYCFVRRIDVVK